ncbi:hypothetical protein M3Y97_00282600 [Aphelenchoides bicaudatus]|nr:hypothetical protein M3Y97_00282600 [Aphelenchoides bicaudatus]
MGCLLSKSNSSRFDAKHNDLNGIRDDRSTFPNSLDPTYGNNGLTANGHSTVNRKDTPSSTDNGPAIQTTTNNQATKPLSQIISNSQTEFFRMLDEKIAKGYCEDSESER